jgi:hypothetical protein
MMWAIGIHLYKVKLPWLQVAKITTISVVAALTAHAIAMQLSPLWAIVWGGSAALTVLFALLYLARVLEPEDRDRFNILAGMLPQSIAKRVQTGLSLLVRADPVHYSLPDPLDALLANDKKEIPYE